MRNNRSGGVGDDIVALVLDHVLGNHSARDGRNPEHVNASGSRSGSIIGIGTVKGYVIPHDDVVIKVLTGRVTMHRDTGESITGQAIVDDHVTVIRGPGDRVKDTDAGAGPLNRLPIFRGNVSVNRIVGDAKRRRAGERRVGGNGDSAVEGIFPHQVSRNQIVVNGGSIIADENSTAVSLHSVLVDGGIGNPDEMQTFAAVKGLRRLKWRYAGASALLDIERFIVVQDIVVRNRDIGGVGSQDALKIGIFGGEVLYNDSVQLSVVKAVDVYGVR